MALQTLDKKHMAWHEGEGGGEDEGEGAMEGEGEGGVTLPTTNT